jgi:hypothetical protein
LKSQIVQMHGHRSLKIATRRNEQQGRTCAPGIASQDGVDFLANRVTVVTVVYPHRLLPSDTNSSIISARFNELDGSLCARNPLQPEPIILGIQHPASHIRGLHAII